MNNYINTIVVAGDGTCSPSFIKLGNRSELEKNQVNFVLPNNIGDTNMIYTLYIKHESGKLFQVDGSYNEGNTISFTVPVAVQSLAGYYTLILRITDNDTMYTMSTNAVKCFIQNDNFGETPLTTLAYMSTIQSPSLAYLTIKDDILYYSNDAENWKLVSEPYIIGSKDDMNSSIVHEYGKVILLNNNDGTWSLKIADGINQTDDLTDVYINDVTDDKLYMRTKDKWITAENLVTISDDNYWVLAGVKTDKKINIPTFSVGEISDTPTPEVSVTGTSENVVFNFGIPHSTNSDPRIGDLATLETTNKDKVVNSINEIMTRINTINTALTSLTWDTLNDRPGIDKKIDIVVSPTEPPTPTVGRTTIWFKA